MVKVAMTSTLFPEMAQSTFQPLLHRLEEDRPQEDYTPDEVRNFLFACGWGAAVLDRLGEMAQGFLHRGMERRKLSFLLKEFIDVIELAIHEVYPKVRSITAGEALPADERRTSLDT